MAEPTLAEVLLTAAERDQQAFEKLAEDPSLHDSLCGFHAQQAVEMALKAVLAHTGVIFRRTHDLAELLDLLEDSDIASPPHADALDELWFDRGFWPGSSSNRSSAARPPAMGS